MIIDNLLQDYLDTIEFREKKDSQFKSYVKTLKEGNDLTKEELTFSLVFPKSGNQIFQQCF